MDEILSDVLSCLARHERPHQAIAEILLKTAKFVGARDVSISLLDESQSFSRVLRHAEIKEGLVGGFFVPLNSSVCGQQEFLHSVQHRSGFSQRICESELLGDDLLMIPMSFLGNFYGMCCFATPDLRNQEWIPALEMIGCHCASLISSVNLKQQKQQADYDNRLYHQLAETLETMGRQENVESLFRYATQRLRSLLRIHNVTFLQLSDERLLNPLVAKSVGFEVPPEWRGSVSERRAVAMQVSVHLRAHFFPISQGEELLGAVQIVTRPTELPRREHGRMLDILLSATGTCMKKAASLTQAVEAQVSAEHANHAKAEFLANISHEIRTPLTSIVGLSSLLCEQCDDPDQLELLDTIVRSADILKSVISDLLDMSRIESGRIGLTPKAVVLSDFVDHCASMLEAPAEKKGLSLTRAVHIDTPQALVFDEARVAQILLNLISNAIKYTDRGSVRLEVNYDDSSGHASFGVIDTGLGIPETNLKQVFEPFYQHEGSQHRDRGGVGLGLAIAQKLANLMGGEIEVRSRLGDGSSFTLTLPLQPENSKAGV
ncbi:MAG: ATP-binding protein [Planctomycetota bacterium]